MGVLIFVCVVGNTPHSTPAVLDIQRILGESEPLWTSVAFFTKCNNDAYIILLYSSVVKIRDNVNKLCSKPLRSCRCLINNVFDYFVKVPILRYISIHKQLKMLAVAIFLRKPQK